MRVKIYLIAAFALMMTFPAWAESRSVTVRMSCSVAPMMQMTARGVETNFPDPYSTSEKFEHRSGVKTKVVTSTLP